MRQLPSLNGIKAFEAAARYGSFSAAAAELNVTPAAVSRSVRLLEERLGVGLFVRQANKLVSTHAGNVYREGLTPILDAIADLTAEVMTSETSRVLTIGAGPTFAIRWLIPRLADFHACEPEIELRVATGGAAAPFAEDWTCGVKLGDGVWPGFVAEPLFAADLMPVCAPNIATDLKSPADLSPRDLIRVAHATDDWPLWLRGSGMPRLAIEGPEFEFYGQALQAAADGLGVAMGIRPYIDDDLAAGRLVAPFHRAVSKGMHWYLVYREARSDEPDFSAFRKWITNTARAPLAPAVITP